MPSFEILFGDYWFEVLPEDYVTDIENGQNQCSVCIRGGSDMWMLGDVFLRGLYSIHDHEDMRMGFVPHAGSTKSAPSARTTELTEAFPGDRSNLYNINDYLIIFAILAVSTFIICLCRIVLRSPATPSQP